MVGLKNKPPVLKKFVQTPHCRTVGPQLFLQLALCCMLNETAVTVPVALPQYRTKFFLSVPLRGNFDTSVVVYPRFSLLWPHHV